jgi:hypothetical protein
MKMNFTELCKLSTGEFSLGMRRVEVLMSRVAAYNAARDSPKVLNDAVCPPQLARPAGGDTSDDSDFDEDQDEKNGENGENGEEKKQDDEKKNGENGEEEDDGKKTD